MIQDTLDWHAHGKLTSPAAKSVQHTQTLIDELAEARQIIQLFMQQPTHLRADPLAQQANQFLARTASVTALRR